jgi:aspartyl-tRNA(Asn)/glutamyl-tRNA(Gln) amidotransferase subunit C
VSLSKELVQRIATLAHLQLEEDDFDDVVAKLSSIIDLFDQLQQVPTDNVEPMAHPLHQVQRLHPDVVTEANERDAIQTNAPTVQDGFYLVPKVIE